MAENRKLFILVEEKLNAKSRLNTGKQISSRNQLDAQSSRKLRGCKVREEVFSVRLDLDEAIGKHSGGESLYEMATRYIRRLRSPCFIKKNGKLDEAGFYTYAMIGKNTWSNIRWNTVVPKKETLLKLVIALRLTMEEAAELMAKGGSSLTDQDYRDRVIMALIDIGCYEIEEVWEVLEEYGKNGPQPFENIYKEKGEREKDLERGKEQAREKRRAGGTQ